MVADRQDLRRRLSRLAASQSGHFTAAQALEIGYSYPAQKHHADRGNWIRVERGVFRLPEWPVGPYDDLVRWSLWAPASAAVSHDTAAVVHDLGDLNPAVVHLTVPVRFRGRATGVRLHVAPLPSGDVIARGGYRVTTPRRTIRDLAAGGTAVDLLAAVIVDALDAGVTDAVELRADAAEHLRGASRSRLLAALSEAEGR